MEKLIDIHCHILPGLDDGAENLEQSTNMIKIAYEDGIRKIIATPHYHIGRPIADSNERKEALGRLQDVIGDLGLDITVYAGNEIYYFSEAMDKLNDELINTMAGSRCILIEFDPGSEYTRIQKAVSESVINGYVPIIAHIERYICITDNIKRCEELVKMGALIQVNAQSTMGVSGKTIQKFIKKILKKHLVSFIASDAHSDVKRRPILCECYKYIQKKFNEDYAREIFYENPMKIIEDKF